MFKQIIQALVLFSASLFAQITAANDSVTGRWKVLDGDTQQPQCIMHIYEQGGEVVGKIEKLFNDDKPRCHKCTGALKDAPLEGLVVMSGFKAVSGKKDAYGGGKIFDPKSGNHYRAKMRTEDGGKKLKVRGFLGFSLLGQTQTWYRVE